MADDVAEQFLPSPLVMKKKPLARELVIRKAVLKGDLVTLKKEVEKGGVDINWADQNKATYAHHAAFRGNLEILEYLKSEGAFLDLLDADGCPPLHNAAYQGRRKCIQFLLANGANPNAVDFDRASAIHKAAFNGHRSCIKELVLAGCDPSSLDVENVSPLQKAVYNDHLKCVQYFVEKARDTLDIPDVGGSRAIHKAAFNGNVEILQFLIESGAEIRAGDAEGLTAIHQAAFRGSAPCIRVLIERGSDVNSVSSYGMAPIHFAAAKGVVQCVQLLCENGAGIDLQDKKGMTALHYAAKQQRKSVASELIKLGANKEIQDRKGRRPIDLVRKSRPIWAILDGSASTPNLKKRGKRSSFARNSSNRDLGHRSIPRSSLNQHANEDAGSHKKMNGEREEEPHRHGKKRRNSGGNVGSNIVRRPEKQRSATYSQHDKPNEKIDEERAKSDVMRIGTSSRKDIRELKITVASGGGTLGGGRALPEGTSKQTAIDDAVSAWSGAPPLEEPMRKSAVNRLFKIRHHDKQHRASLEIPTKRETLRDPGFSQSQSRLAEMSSESLLIDPPACSEPNLSPRGISSPVYVDKWGFLHPYPPRNLELSKLQRSMDMEAEMEWLKTIKKLKPREQYQPKVSKKFCKRVQQGIPMSVRGVVWGIFLNIPETFPNKYEELVKSKVENSKVFLQIDLDLNRTFPNHVRFQKENGPGQQAMRRVLQAYARYNPRIGYCQGMGFVVALFLMVMDEEDVFWCLVKLCLPGNGTYADTVDLERGFGMGGLYENHLPLVSEYVYVIERLMKQFLPRLNAHIEEEGISVGLFAPQYLITIFLYNMPFSTCIRIWDMVISRGYNFVFNCLLSLLKNFEEDLLTRPFDEFMTWVKLAHFNDRDVCLETDLIIGTALGYLNKPYAVKPKLLDSLRREYREKEVLEEKKKKGGEEE